MAGIYIHIPFCRKACHYCNFHFSTTLKHQSDLVKAITKEISLKQDYLANEEIETIYFGGGTPSILQIAEIESILKSIQTHFKIKPNSEITLEANPDDLDRAYLQDLKSLGVNRLSIGIQSFFEQELEFMNRSHNADQAHQCIENESKYFDELSIDCLLYTSPSPRDLSTSRMPSSA